MARLIGAGEVVFLMVDNHVCHLVSRHGLLWPTSASFPGATTTRTATSRSTSARAAWISPPRWPAITLRSPRPGPESRRVSCEELMAAGAPQLLFAKASLMLNAFYALREGRLNYSEVYLDILQNASRAVSRPV